MIIEPESMPKGQQRAHAEFLRSVLSASADCIKVLDLDGKLRFMNERALQLMEVDHSVRTIEFSGNSTQSSTSITVTERGGTVLRSAYAEAQSELVAISGPIELINGKSFTFVLVNSVTGKQVTCQLTAEWFNDGDREGYMRRNVVAHVFGDFSRKKIRDHLQVRRAPTYDRSQLPGAIF